MKSLSPKFKVSFKIFCMAVLLVGLGFKVHFMLVSHGIHKIDPPFMKHYNAFLLEARKRGYDLSQINISITFSSVPLQTTQLSINDEAHELGHCRLIFGQDPSIALDVQRWNQLSPVRQEMTIFHELSHCLLLKGHTSGLHQGIHRSLMNPLIFSEQEYLSHRTDFLNEIFSYHLYHAKDYVFTFFLANLFPKKYTLTP